MTRRFPLLTISLFLSLLWAACGSSSTQPATPPLESASGAPAAQPGADEPASGESEVDPTSICEQYSRKYCTDDGTSYEEFSPEQQRELMEECEKAVRAADEQKLAAIEKCLGCVADCLATASCLQGASLCASDDEDEYEDGDAE